jgi:para-aminobenzoate synthetase / 4-amino-4-deoxychorismate lyase
VYPPVRFDDLRAGRSFACPSPDAVVSAAAVGEVLPVLEEVRRATAAGRWAYGYLAYEAAPGLDTDLVTHDPRPGDPPLAWFALGGPPVDVPALDPPPRGPAAGPWRPDWTDEEHARAVAAVRASIAAGDTYQVNLTDRLRTRLSGSPEDLYAALAARQTGAFHAWLDLGEHVVVSASPELLVDWTGATLLTRPMKGTAARGTTPAEDAAAAERLRASAKERAENLMIVDLLRNDLSRVARTGSVAVRSLFDVEAYPTVWQLTSEIVATARPGTTLVDLLRALFPSGSVTGAPKLRTMQLIRGLEPTPRGVYCGAIGFAGPPDSGVRATFSVPIRTAVVHRATGEAVYGAGGGIVWDSDPAAERAELLAKAAVLGSPPDGTLPG